MNRNQIQSEFDNFPLTLPSGEPWTCVDFAVHIAMLEREACAQLCDGREDMLADMLASEIRARGNE